MLALRGNKGESKALEVRAADGCVAHSDFIHAIIIGHNFDLQFIFLLYLLVNKYP